MRNKKHPLKKNKLKIIRYLLISWFPISRRKHDKYCFNMLQIIAAHKEQLMIIHQDIFLLANKMIKFHGAELMREKNLKSIDPTIQTKKETDEIDIMYR